MSIAIKEKEDAEPTPVTIKCTEHDFETTDATCTADGSKKCKNCDATQIIPATGHTEETVEGKAATCTEKGLTEGKKCSVCGEILIEQTEIPITHDYAENIFIYDYSADKYYRICKICDDSPEIAKSDLPAYYGLKIKSGITEIENVVFSFNDSLTSVSIPDTVTTIGVGAFQGCDGLTIVEIPGSVTTIGENAFADCINLEEVILTSNLTKIEDGAFSGCVKLERITIPNSVTSLGRSVFSGCSNLEEVTLSSGLTAIDDFTFYKCESLSNITIPNGIESIGIFAFELCTSLQSISLPTSLEEIGVAAFMGCTSLNSVSAPSVKSIQAFSFQGCSSLEKFNSDTVGTVVIPSGATTIGESAFEGCSNVTALSLPVSVTLIDVNAFKDCNSLTNVTYEGTAEEFEAFYHDMCNESWWGDVADFGWATNHVLCSDRYSCYLDEHDFVEVPEVNATCTEGGAYKHYYCNYCKGTSLKNYGGVDFDADYTMHTWSTDSYVVDFDTSGKKHFYYFCEVCGTLEESSNPEYGDKPYELIIKAGTTAIPNNCFAYYELLSEITISDSVTTIGEEAFWGCYSLSEIEIPSSVTTIGDRAFLGCEGLTSIVIPNSVESLGAGFAYNCTSLKNVTLPSNIATIPSEAFLSCEKLTSITIPTTVTTIGNLAFCECISLTEIVIPSSVTTIGDYAFSECGITSIEIPDSVTNLGSGFVEWCTNLTDITLPSNITTIPAYAFCGCESLTTYSIPTTVKTIGNSAFASSGLTEIVIPNSVETIENNAFYNCSSLESVKIPTSVTYIGGYIFYNCTSLTSINYLGTVSDWGNITKHSDWNNESSIKYVTCSDDGVVCLTHELTHHEAVEPTCIATGNDEYWECSNCGKYFSDEDCSDEIAENSWVVEATGHTWSDTSFTYVFKEALGDWYANCEKCDAHKDTEEANNPEAGGKLYKVIISDGVTTIPEGWFAQYQYLSEIIIPNSVTSIGEEAFWGCALTSLNIPDSVTDLGRAFAYVCTSLETVKLPSNIAKIPDDAFGCCESLTSITIPNTVTEIGNGAFAGCSSLTEVTLPSNIAIIPDYAFDYCESLTSITIPASVTEIGEYALSNCTSLESIVFEGTVSEWVAIDKDDAWIEGSSIEYVTCEDGNCCIEHSLEHFTVDSTCTENGEEYWYCDECNHEFADEDGNTLGRKPVPLLPHALESHVMNCGEELLENDPSFWYWKCTSCGKRFLNSDGTNEIADLHTLNLHNFEYHEAVDAPCDEGGSIAHWYCLKCGLNCADDLGEIELENITTHDYYLLLTDLMTDCPTLKCKVCGDESTCDYRKYYSYTEAVVPEGKTEVGNNSYFRYMRNLEKVTLPSTVTTINSYAFLECTSLITVNIPSGVTVIKDGTFDTCTSLPSIAIPASVTVISANAFKNCSSLTSITYDGTKAAWLSATNGVDWHSGVPESCRITCSDGVLDLNGNEV